MAIEKETNDCITKRDFIQGMAKKMNMPYGVASHAYEAFWDEIDECLINGHIVNLYGRGTFSLKLRKGRLAERDASGKGYGAGSPIIDGVLVEKEEYFTLKFNCSKPWRQAMRKKMKEKLEAESESET